MCAILKKSLKYLILFIIVTFICVNNEPLFVNAEGVTINSNENERLLDIDINGEFDDKSLIVVLEPSISQYYGLCSEFKEKLYTIEEVESYDDLSELSVESLVNDGIDPKCYSSIKNHLDSIDFKQILKINLNTTSKQEVVEIIKQIETFDEVFSVNPNYVYESNDAIVDDVYFGNQWALIGTHGIDINEAWNFTTGSSNIRVGIIDSGIANHLDLNSNVVTGKDFYNNNYITTDDIGGHGTSVAGIIGAIANNARGVAGINHNISLVPLQTAYDTSGNGNHYTTDIVEAIRYARDLWEDPENRIHIINYSISRFGYNTDVLSAVESFKGLFVWAAGNNGENLDLITGIENFSLNNLISVGAHDQNGQRSIWNSSQSSSYGQIVNIYAPSVCYTTHSITNNSYRTFGGTSCATPHVTGVAALLLSLDEEITASQLKQTILQSAENINITTPDGSTQNVKKLNAYNAVKYVLSNYGSSTTLKYNTTSLSKSIDSTSTFFNEKNYFLKMNVENAYTYDFTISSSSASEVTLYDSNFNEINVSQASTNGGLTKTFSYYLSVGTYYLQSNYVSSTASGTINVSIVGEPHTHTYTYLPASSGHTATCTVCGYTTTLSHIYDDHYCIHCNAYTTMHDYDRNYEWVSYTMHRAECCCGATAEQGHAVASNAFANGKKYAPCLICGGLAERGFVEWTNSSAINQVTNNGSYILPNGVIVLVDEDIESYLNGSLEFHKKDDQLSTE